jgi:alkanesulfonate monooxygenase SsuD/methylene tetrahydromethanopterin reductase-like flavin-dependent oxidoreductase (luciferase family)
VNASVRAGLELTGRQVAEAGEQRLWLEDVATWCEGHELGALWLSSGHGPDAVDGLPIAAWLSSRVSRLTFGLVVPVEGGRLPGIVARDLSSLDVVTGGRSAVLLEAGPEQGGSERLGEAVAICRGILAGALETFEGSTFAVRDAVNLPPPRQEGGPPVLAESGSVSDASWVHESMGPAAVVVSGGPTDVEATVRSLGNDAAGGGVPVIWRGTAIGESLGSVLRDVSNAGAWGFIVRSPGQPDEEFVRALGAASHEVLVGG